MDFLWIEKNDNKPGFPPEAFFLPAQVGQTVSAAAFPLLAALGRIRETG